MMEALRSRHPGASLWRIFAWYAMHFLCFVWVTAWYRYRAWGVNRIPSRGPVLLVSNHQSFYDPLIVGIGGHKRQFWALARSTLFKNPFFAGLIRLLNAIPVEQGAGDTAAMRQCISVLKDNQTLLIFAEGARTKTGQTQPFEPGTMLLIKRAKPTIVPVAIEGAYDVWPRKRKLPKLRGSMAVTYGHPIPSDRLLKMKPTEAMDFLREQIEVTRLQMREKMQNWC